MKSIFETCLLPFIYLKFLCFTLKEEKKVKRLFYTKPCFKKVDLSLKQLYQGQSPYKICKDFMMKSQKTLSHVYGETPLTELYKILLLCNIKKEDVFLDLGCGRGRSVFFVSSFFPCKAKGIDIVPIFYERAQKVATSSLSSAEFLCQDMSSCTLSKATIIYFYALCLEESLLEKMIQKLAALKPGTKILTVSFPLSDYSKAFSTLFVEKALYPWGETEVFLNAVNE